MTQLPGQAAPPRRDIFSVRAPRYTSYPPATQFTDSVGPDMARTWLGQVKVGEAISLYAHIPFCRRLCWFCACRTQGTKTDAPLAPYVDALLEEADLVAAALPGPVSLSHLHLGGGTPTILPPDLIATLFDGLRARFPTTAPGAEISVEVDPTEQDGPRLDALAAAGVTRASVGIQDFEPAVQEAIGRPQTPQQTAEAVTGLRARGIARVNFDLLYGLPHQTPDTLSRTLDIALGMRPDRMALYGYAHVPWASKRQVMIDGKTLPGGPDRLRLAEMAARRLEDAGYLRIGIDHFAKPDDPMAIAAGDGTLRRNFQGYTTDAARTLIGLGASAISRLPGGHAQNAARTADWRDRIRAGRLATARGHAMTADDTLRARMIERLLCDFRLVPAQFGDAAPAVRRHTAEIVLAWPRACTRIPDGTLTIRDEARHLARLIAMVLDAYASPDGRHSVAI
ncbi:MAG: oxygen-independent coproporphyrinogen III oxidase [Pseudomonadota bacterium]